MIWLLVAPLISAGFWLWLEIRSRRIAEHKLSDATQNIFVLESRLKTVRHHGEYFATRIRLERADNVTLKKELKGALEILERSDPASAGRLVRDNLRRLLQAQEHTGTHTGDGVTGTPTGTGND